MFYSFLVPCATITIVSKRFLFMKFDKDSFVKVRNNIRKIDDKLIVINSVVYSGSHTIDGYNKYLKSTLKNLESILVDFQNIESHYICDK